MVVRLHLEEAATFQQDSPNIKLTFLEEEQYKGNTGNPTQQKVTDPEEIVVITETESMEEEDGAAVGD